MAESQQFQLNLFKTGFTVYVTKMKNDGDLKHHHVRKMKAQLRAIGDVSKGMGKDTGTDTEKFQTELRSNSDDSGSELNRSQDDLPISEQERIKFENLLHRVFNHHVGRIPLALQISAAYILSGIVEVPSFVRNPWNIDVQLELFVSQ